MCGCAPDRADDGTQLVTRWRRLAHVRGETPRDQHLACRSSLSPRPRPRSPASESKTGTHPATAHANERYRLSHIGLSRVISHVNAQEARVSLASFSTSGPIRILLNILIT